MYETFYGFAEKPFSLTPDPKFLFLSPRHAEAFAHLEFGRREKGGFILISGEVGTGKTTLARYFLSRLDARTATACVLYPAVTAAELLRTILEDLHAPVTGTTLKDHVDALHRFLLRARAEGRDVVLLIDEAQDLSPEVLEQVRLLSNLETDTEKLIQIVLMGQSELAALLARPDLRQLAQRVTARYHLTPMSRPETEEYVRHRLRVAGGEGKAVFTPAALDALQRATQGIPRLLNLVCDRALLGGFVAGTRTVDAQLVRRAASEVVPLGEGRARGGLAASLVALAALAAALGIVTLRGTGSSAETPVTPVVNAQGPAPQTLAPRLLAQPCSASEADAVAAIDARWGGGSLQRTRLRTHLAQLRRLDLPAALEMFHPRRGETCHVALLEVAGDEALVSFGGDTFRAALGELDRHWTRNAIVVWRDHDGVAAAGDAARMQWTLRLLQAAGFGTATEGAAAIARFQQREELVADGVVGPRTLLALYARGPYPRPHLEAAR